MGVRTPWQVHIVGSQAVGKMTVGQVLSRITGVPLLYNHQIIDLLTPMFPFGTPAFNRLADNFRNDIVDETAEAGRNLILTGGWPFDDPSILPIVARMRAAAIDRGGQACFVELRAPLDVRLERNQTENRQRHKRRDWATDAALTALTEAHRWESNGDFPWPDEHLVIENASVTPGEAAAAIIERFGLPRA
ncbi:MAG: shikimate kinase [Chloroflexi bacterium]|nr:shikimate kinase [Chloroflexota bacterium]